LRTDSYNLNTPISPSQQQFYRQAHLQHQRRHQHALFQRHTQFLNHQRSTSRKTKRYRTFVHTAARGIGTSTPNDFDYILFLLFQGGLLRYGPDPCEKRNRTLIIRSAELTSVHKLGFQFWNQYSDVDSVFVRRILLAINTQETNRLAKQQTQRRDRHRQSVFAKYEPIIEASSVSLPHPTYPLPAAFDAATDQASISEFPSQPASICVYSDPIGPFCHDSSVSEVAILHPSGLSLPSFD
jgi:hypothetical protein